MKMRASWALVFGAGLALGKAWQDPVPAPTPPTPAAVPTPAAQEPAAAKAENEGKPVIGAPKASPFVGVYRLSARHSEGDKVLDPGSGHLVVTARHLVLAAAAPGPKVGSQLLRTSVRTWSQSREHKGRMVTRVVAGWLTDDEGNLVVEPAGTEELRTFELVRGGIRIAQDHRNWLEFERIE
jgi:hypothetical protein